MATATLTLGSQNRWLADGSTTIWNFNFTGGYLSTDTVKAYSFLTDDTVRTDHTMEFLSDFQVRISPAVAAARTLVIYRDSSNNGLPRADFTDGGGITEENLDTLAKQAIFVSTEMEDFLGISTEGSVSAVLAAVSAGAGATSAAAASAAASASASATSAAASVAAKVAAEAAQAGAELAESNATAILPLLAGTGSGQGGSIVGLPDVAAYWSSTSVEAFSAEIGAILATMGARPERYADPGSGGDYTAALQSALNEGKGLYLQRGKIYGINAELTNTAHNVGITGGGTIKFLAGYNKSGGTLSAISNTGSYFVVDAVVFDGSAVTSAAVASRFVFGNGLRLIVTNKARFLNLPSTNLGITFQGALQCSGNAAYSVVSGAFFYNCPGAIFFQGRRSVAVGNVVINPHDASIALNGVSCIGCVVSGNIVSNEDANASIASMIAVEEGASEWVISNNYISGIKDGRAIAAISIGYLSEVRGGKIIGNVVNGASYTTTNPCSLIEYSQYYTHVDVIGNELFNLPTGNSNSRAMILAATGGRCANNKIDGANVTGQVICEIRQGALGLTIDGNTTRSGASGQHYWFQAGNYAGNPVHFKGGKTYGGTNGINAETNIASITGLKLYIDSPEDNSTTNYITALTQLGARSTWLAAGAWAFPCHIGIRTEMYGSPTPPTAPAAGNQAFVPGDKINYQSPVFPGYTGAQLVASTWRNYGAIA